MAEQELSTLPELQAHTELARSASSDLAEPASVAPESPRENSSKTQPTSMKRSQRKTNTTTRGATSRKASQKQAESTHKSDERTPVKSTKSSATKTKTPRKKSTGAKKSTSEKPRASRTSKKPTLVAKPVEPAEIAEAIEPVEDTTARDFASEPELTPVKARKIDEAELRSELFSDLVLEMPPLEVEAEKPSDEDEETLERPAIRTLPPPDEDEETLERPAIRTPPRVELQIAPPVTPSNSSANGHVVVLPGRDLDVTPPETPLAPLIEEESIPDTPLPSIDDVKETVLDHFEPAYLEPEHKNGAIAVQEAPPMLVPVVIDAETLQEIAPSIAPSPAPVAKPMRFRVALVLVLIIALCIIPLWRDVNAAHLYLYSISPLDGQVRAQQDLGSDYANTSILTNPVLLQSSLLVGLTRLAANSIAQRWR